MSYYFLIMTVCKIGIYMIAKIMIIGKNIPKGLAASPDCWELLPAMAMRFIAYHSPHDGLQEVQENPNRNDPLTARLREQESSLS